MIITLNPEDAVAAASSAALQMVRKVALERRSDHGGKSRRSMRERWADGIHGAMAEIAVSRAMNLSWTPGGRMVSTGDVGGKVEVRATEHEDGHLLIYEKDDPRSLYVLAVGHYPSFRIMKPMRGAVAKALGFLKSSDPPCYWVSQDNLEEL